MLVAFFFKSLFLLASIEFKTIFKLFCFLLCVATELKGITKKNITPINPSGLIL